MLDRAKNLYADLMRRRAMYVHHTKKIKAAQREGARSGVVEVTDGNLKHSGNVFAAFLIWQPDRTEWSVENALDAFREIGVNVLLVVNHQVLGDRLPWFLDRCHTLMIRDNYGLDIGGFRDATFHLAENHEPDRVLYLNDSVYYYRDGLSALLSRMAQSDDDICAPFENWEIHHHVQSFCMSVSGTLFRRPQFQGFWQNYLPVASRVWAINQGEVGLSRAMVPLARSTDIIFSPAKIVPLIKDLPRQELWNLVSYMPAPIRFDAAAFRHRSTTDFTTEMSRRLASGSQVHTGGFVFKRFMGNPIIKKDLVFRHQFEFYDVERLLCEVGLTESLNVVLADLRKKGLGARLPREDYFKFCVGLK